MSQLEIYREKFAETGWQIFELAVEETLRRRQKRLGVEHLLHALVRARAEYFLSLLRSLSESPEAMAMLTDLIEERLAAAPGYEGRGLRLAAETIDLFKHTLRRVRSQGRQRMEAADLFITLVTEKDSLLREILARLLEDPRAKSKHVRDLFAIVEGVGAASRPYSGQKYRYIAGEMVRIKRGVFASFTGRVETVDEEQGVLNIRVLIFGRERPVELSFVDVEKIKFDE